jgi:hypothetical protein
MVQQRYEDWSARVKRLAEVVAALEATGAELGLPAVGGEAWHSDLFQKLRPQVEGDPYLVVAVMGGTNIGKSTIFNHLAGCRASRVHHDATQTKHPVCMVPWGFAARNDLATIFPEFQLRPWTSEEDALLDGPDNLMFLREDPSGAQPDRLLLLDTPDVDGALSVNWNRARLVRHAADVLVCVLTQQKYNDAAIRQFFREAAQSDKTVLVVFNMIHAWPDDADLCRGWLRTFQEGTGIVATHVYAVPHDRKAVQDNRLPFHALSPGTTDPRRDLAELHFAEIKVRSLRGALRRVLDDGDGLPAYLRTIEARAREYQEARDIIGRGVQVQVEAPRLPSHVVMDKVWQWLEPRRTTYDRVVHKFYGKVGAALTYPFRTAPADLEAEFTRQEREVLTKALGDVLEKLDLVHRGANPILRRELGAVLAGTQRERIFGDLAARHAELPLLSEGYRRFINDTLDHFAQDNESLMKTIKWSLVGTAVIRPMITVAMFGAPIVLGELAGHAAVHAGTEAVSQAATHAVTATAGQAATHAVSATAGHAATHTATHVATEVATGAAVTVGGEGAMAGMAAPVRMLIARLFSRYYQERAELLGQAIHDCVVGQRLDHIGRLASMADLPAHRTARELVASLGSELAGGGAAPQDQDQDGPPEAPRSRTRVKGTTP